MNKIKNVEDRTSAIINQIKEAVKSGDSEIQKFYYDSIVFVTGGGGFLGKQLIEKLIRSTNVKKVYTLLRPKKGKDIYERLEKILQDPVYADLHNEQPTFVNKIVAIEGDVAEINLGINEENWLILVDEVNIIFHAAATISFVDKISKATLTNVRGTSEMIKFARACKNIKSIVHISTAYSHATKSRAKQRVKDDFYGSPISPNTLIQLSETVDEDILSRVISPLIENWPNSYTFTKAVAEELVRNHAENLPICIVRPAIVTAAYGEPTAGWLDPSTAFGTSGIITGSSLGVLHTLLSKPDTFTDLVPVDFVNNAIIVAAWKTCERYKSGDEQKIIYTVTNTRNPMTWGDVSHILNHESEEFMTTKAIWYCFTLQTQFKSIYVMLTWLLHYIPAMLIDGCCFLVGRKPRFYKMYRQATNLIGVFEFFLRTYWYFDDSNTIDLFNQLSVTDKVIYNFDMCSIDKKELIWTICYGVKKFIVKDDVGDTESGKKKQFWLKISHYIIFPLYLYLLYKVLYFVFFLVFNVMGLLKYG